MVLPAVRALADDPAADASYRTFLHERRTARRPGFASALWNGFVRLFDRAPRPAPEPPLAVPSNGRAPGGPGDPERVADWFRRHLAEADALATHYVGLYRSAVLTNYVLGALAVVLAVVGFINHSRIVGIGEIVVLAAIVFVALAAKRRWHRRSIEYRILAEHLRPMPVLAMLGATLPSARPRARHEALHEVRGTWMNDHFRAVLRNSPLVAARCTESWLRAVREGMASSWIAAQRSYHAYTAHRAHAAHRALEAASMGLFILSLAGVVWHLADQNSPWPLLLTAAGPALAAALHGIASHASLQRLADRSNAMASWLETVERELQETPARSEPLRRVAYDVASVVMEEVSEWHVIYRSTSVPVH
jgi:hypothetical protein